MRSDQLRLPQGTASWAPLREGVGGRPQSAANFFRITCLRIFPETIGVMTRQLGQLFLQPMVDAMWEQLAGGSSDDGKPVSVVGVEGTPATRTP